MVQALSLFFLRACQELVHTVVWATSCAYGFFGFSVGVVGACEEVVHTVVGPPGCARDVFFDFFFSSV